MVTNNGNTTTTNYIGTNEEVSTTGSTTTTTKYYNAGGVASVTNVNGTLSYLVKDFLGSTTMALDMVGNVIATTLYAPYGMTRYSTGTMPTTRSYTSMASDPSGLFYDHARYYDGGVGQFTSADTEQGPNRYGYVAGNPETYTDPTGHFCWSCLGYVNVWWNWWGRNTYIHLTDAFVSYLSNSYYAFAAITLGVGLLCLTSLLGWLSGCSELITIAAVVLGAVGGSLWVWDYWFCGGHGIGIRMVDAWWHPTWGWPTC